jgi:spoIIIJ-associated protein
MSEWVEVRGRTVELAVQVGLEELGLDSADHADVEVMQEASKGFLGMGGQDAIVRLKAKPKRRRRRRGRGRKGDGDSARGGRQPESGDRTGRPDAGGKDRRPERGGGKGRGAGSEREAPQQQGKRQKQPRQQRQQRQQRQRQQQPKDQEEPKVSVDINEQAAVVQEFLRGLVDAFGFEGEVTTRVEDDVIYADIAGAETEALVGEKGSVMQAVLELARTVVQRKTQEGARIRLDIAGYGSRRREALQIYAKRLAEQVLEEGGEIMLEPMNPADRKVVHDAINEIDGVRTYSEGEEPRRSVVVAPE